VANYYTHFTAYLKDLTPEQLAWCVERLRRARAEEQEDEEGNPMFEFDWTPKADALHIYSDERSNVEHVASFVQEFLRTFRPRDSWSLQYANVCDKRRSDGFGGGALFVTANEVQWFDTGSWLQEREAAHV
jgi:hypothetical protein